MITLEKIIYKESQAELHLNSGEKLIVSIEIPGKHNLSQSSELDESLYLLIQYESNRYTAFQKALSYLAIRNRSEKEIFIYLQKKKYDKEVITETINKLKDYDYLSDFDFAVEYINSKQKRKTIGVNYLKKNLYGKGIKKELINKAIKKTDASSYDFEKVYELAKKKYESIKNKPNSIKKVSYFLNQRGFDYDIIKKVIRHIQAEYDENSPDWD